MARQRFCEGCKQQIEADRAEGLPDTRLCARHAREFEKYGGEFTLSGSRERTSKAGSLKLNYGGVSRSPKPATPKRSPACGMII